MASRGMSIPELMESNCFSGPNFLWELEIHPDPVSARELDGDPEVKRVLTTTQTPINVDYQHLEAISLWEKAARMVATPLKVAYIVKGHSKELAVHQQANHLIVKWCQQEHFRSEISSLKMTHAVDKQCKIAKLSPFLDSDGLLRIGGRLKYSSLPQEQVHPLLLPNTAHVAQLLIGSHHRKVGHTGKGLTMNSIRTAGYWITSCGSAVSSYISKCVTCRKLHGKPQTQVMADLPSVRTEPSTPFTHVGCDCFRPILVKERRQTLKCYGVLFTCLVSRAVHMELAEDLSSDAFISSLRRLIALRDPVSSLHCDQGT